MRLNRTKLSLAIVLTVALIAALPLLSLQAQARGFGGGGFGGFHGGGGVGGGFGGGGFGGAGRGLRRSWRPGARRWRGRAAPATLMWMLRITSTSLAAGATMAPAQ